MGGYVHMSAVMMAGKGVESLGIGVPSSCESCDLCLVNGKKKCL